MASLFVEYLLQGLSDSFRKYFQQNCTKAVNVQGQLVRIPLFFAGMGSVARVGHGPSQNTAEAAVQVAKEVLNEKPISEIELLKSLTQRYKLCFTCPTPIHGFLGPSQEKIFSPIPLGRCSPDVVEGDGRCWRSIGECVWWPSAAQILEAHRKTKQSIVNIGKFHILKRFWCIAKNYTVSSADAADMARMMTAHSFDEVKASWCQAGVIEVGDAGVEHFNWKRARFFFWELAVVVQHRTGNLECTCSLYRDTSECGHLVAIHQHLGTGAAPMPVPIVRCQKGAGRGKGRGRGLSAKGNGRKLGWRNPDEHFSDEEPIAAEEQVPEGSFLVPLRLRETVAKELTASTDSIQRCCMIFMFGTRSQPRKLHTLVMVSHAAGEGHATLTESGRNELAAYLFENGNLQMVGLMISHHKMAAGPSIADVQQMFACQGIAGQTEFCLSIVWRQGLEPSPGISFFGRRSDRADVEPQVEKHEALDFVSPLFVSEADFKVDIQIKGAPVKDPGAQSSGSRGAALTIANPNLKLARSMDVLHFLHKEAEKKKNKTLPVREWMDEVPVVGGVRTRKDAANQIKEALEALAARQLLSVRRSGRSDRWDIKDWVVELK